MQGSRCDYVNVSVY